MSPRNLEDDKVTSSEGTGLNHGYTQWLLFMTECNQLMTDHYTRSCLCCEAELKYFSMFGMKLQNFLARKPGGGKLIFCNIYYHHPTKAVQLDTWIFNANFKRFCFYEIHVDLNLTPILVLEELSFERSKECCFKIHSEKTLKWVFPVVRLIL